MEQLLLPQLLLVLLPLQLAAGRQAAPFLQWFRSMLPDGLMTHGHVARTRICRSVQNQRIASNWQSRSLLQVLLLRH